jgi:hypothetical protein
MAYPLQQQRNGAGDPWLSSLVRTFEAFAQQTGPTTQPCETIEPATVQACKAFLERDSAPQPRSLAKVY